MGIGFTYVTLLEDQGRLFMKRQQEEQIAVIDVTEYADVECFQEAGWDWITKGKSPLGEVVPSGAITHEAKVVARTSDANGGDFYGQMGPRARLYCQGKKPLNLLRVGSHDSLEPKEPPPSLSDE